MLPVSASFADLTTVRVPTTPRGKSWKMSLVPGKSWNLLGQGWANYGPNAACGP